MADLWLWLAGANAAVVVAILWVNYKYRCGIFKFYGGSYMRQQDDRNKDQDIRMDNLERVQKERAGNYKKINEIDHIKSDIGYIKQDITTLKEGHKDLVSRDDEMMKILVEIKTTLNIMREDKKKGD